MSCSRKTQKHLSSAQRTSKLPSSPLLILICSIEIARKASAELYPRNFALIRLAEKAKEKEREQQKIQEEEEKKMKEIQELE